MSIKYNLTQFLITDEIKAIRTDLIYKQHRIPSGFDCSYIKL